MKTKHRLVWQFVGMLLAVLAAQTLVCQPASRPVQAGSTMQLTNEVQAYIPQVYLGGFDLPRWQMLPSSHLDGGLNTTPGWTMDHDMAIGPDGYPVVAWSLPGHTQTKEIYVRRWNGQDWVEIGEGSASGGGISQTGGGSFWPRLAIARDGTIFVAWKYVNTLDVERIYLRKWDGQGWVEVGPHSASPPGVRQGRSLSAPALALSPAGTPHLAWHEKVIKFHVYMLRWDGRAWVEVSEGSASGDGIRLNVDLYHYDPALAFAPDGLMYLAWKASLYVDRGEIYVLRWDGSRWSQVGQNSALEGGISNTYDNSDHPWVAVAPNGMPYVIWLDKGDGLSGGVYLRRWNGSSWEEVGSGSASGFGLDGDAAGVPRLAISPDNEPFVSYPVNPGYERFGVYVQRWDGSAWVAAGVGAASGTGLAVHYGTQPVIAINQAGSAYVAWQELMETTPESGYQLFVKATP